MNLKHLVSRRTFSCLSRFNARFLSQSTRNQRHFTSYAPPSSLFLYASGPPCSSTLQKFRSLGPVMVFSRCIQSAQEVSASDTEDEDDGTVNEFLSRFVWIMRGKLNEAFPDLDKTAINKMLSVIAEKVVDEIGNDGVEKMSQGGAPSMPSNDFSEDLWRTVWEVSSKVLVDMEKEGKKEKLKGFLQDEEVKQMCRFAGEVGIRGEMLREFRFKWAREKMEENEFYEGLAKMREDAEAGEEGEQEAEEAEGWEGAQKDSGVEIAAAKERDLLSVTKRRGKLKYKIYGLDLSDSKWAEVADKIHDANEIIWPQEPKPITGRCKLVSEKIFSLKEEDDPSPILAELKEILQPGRIDWITLLDQLKDQNIHLYYKVAELLLSEESYQTNIRDYSKLIDAYANENRVEDAERVLKKMDENSFSPDILTSTILVHMYSKAANIDRAKEAFGGLRAQGFRPDIKAYSSMIMAHAKSGQPKLGESLMREMEARDLNPTEEIYMALLRSFTEQGDVRGAAQIANTMLFVGVQSMESCTLLVEAHAKAGDPDQARSNFDYIIKNGHRPDDRSVASMIAAYSQKNLLDKALDLLLVLQKDHGFEPGVRTYTVLVDWFAKLQLVHEAEQVLGKISEQGEAPPLKIHVSLCDMYSRTGAEKKALQALGVVEARKEEMDAKDFERVINGLIKGGFSQDAQRFHGLMEARGFTPSEPLKMQLMSTHALKLRRPSPSAR